MDRADIGLRLLEAEAVVDIMAVVVVETMVAVQVLMVVVVVEAVHL